jgi:hypothetical protein
MMELDLELDLDLDPERETGNSHEQGRLRAWA